MKQSVFFKLHKKSELSLTLVNKRTKLQTPLLVRSYFLRSNVSCHLRFLLIRKTFFCSQRTYQCSDLLLVDFCFFRNRRMGTLQEAVRTGTILRFWHSMIISCEHFSSDRRCEIHSESHVKLWWESGINTGMTCVEAWGLSLMSVIGSWA